MAFVSWRRTKIFGSVRQTLAKEVLGLPTVIATEQIILRMLKPERPIVKHAVQDGLLVEGSAQYFSGHLGVEQAVCLFFEGLRSCKECTMHVAVLVCFVVLGKLTCKNKRGKRVHQEVYKQDHCWLNRPIFVQKRTDHNVQSQIN